MRRRVAATHAMAVVKIQTTPATNSATPKVQCCVWNARWSAAAPPSAMHATYSLPAQRWTDVWRRRSPDQNWNSPVINATEPATTWTMSHAERSRNRP